MRDSAEVIFIHSLFRSGSTYIYNALKRVGQYHVYHEPFHEIIGSLPSAWVDLASRTDQFKNTLRHQFLSGGYFDEYAHLLTSLGEKFNAEVSYSLFFLEATSPSEVLKSYIDFLVAGAKKKVVLQCTRTIGRVGWLKNNFNSAHIFLLRNPWDQWFSYKVDKYISATTRVIYVQPGLPGVLKAIAKIAGENLPPQGSDINKYFEFCDAYPITPQVDYSLFFGLWVYAYFMAWADCDLTIDMDAITASQSTRQDAKDSLSEFGLSGVVLDDCKLHRATYKPGEEAFYRKIESEVLQTFEHFSFPKEFLSRVRDYLDKNRQIKFMKFMDDPIGLIEDAARLRSNLHDKESEFAVRIAELNEAMANAADRESHLEQMLSDQQVKNQNLEQSVSDNIKNISDLEQLLAGLSSSLTSAEAKIVEREKIIKDHEASIQDLHKAVELRDKRLNDIISSTTWRVMAPVRVFRIATRLLLRDRRQFLAYCLNNISRMRGHSQAPVDTYESPVDKMPTILSERMPAAIEVNSERLTVFTICSKNFTAYAKTLFHSVKKYHPNVNAYLFLCDEVDSGYILETNDYTTVELRELGIPDVEGMAHRYNITEFNTAIKPFAFSYLFRQLGKQNVVYLDPDIILTSPLEEVVGAFSNGAECILTPHILEPAENVETPDRKMLLFGIYNLGFIGLRNTSEMCKVVDWWGRRLINDCVIKIEEGLFVDQKWADLLPAFISRTVILRHPGYNVAYWNLSQRKVELIDGQWYANRQSLRFVHFSGNKLEDSYVLSRHSSAFNRDNIGDLSELLDAYRELVYSFGHAEYSKLPYSFSWNGESGVNLHTPKPERIVDGAESGSVVTAYQTSEERYVRIQNMLGKVRSYWRILQTGSRMAGGWPALVSKGARAFRQGGFSAIQKRAYLVKSYAEISSLSTHEEPVEAAEYTSSPEWVPKLLFIDWSTPRPDRDAGSLTAFHLMKIYVELGYDVTFIPSDLQYLGEYTEAVRALGVRCLHQSDIGSIKTHLEKEGEQYSFALLCRAPIAALHIPDIRKFSPNIKIILNTSDLHYLRDIREAELGDDKEKLEAAKQAKGWELDVIRSCDITIVMSPVEQAILQQEIPDTVVKLIPLMFVEPVHDCPAYEERKDFLFIGGFPHAPNVDAVLFFCKEVLPLVKASLPEATFHIVGNSPPGEVLALGEQPGVIVHGYVKDIAPIFKMCRLSVAPLRYGAGIKGKIGTSMTYGVPVIATSIAAEGMEIEANKHVKVADNPKDFADAIVGLYTSRELWTQLSENGRDQMLRIYSPAAGQRRIASLMREINSSHKQIDLFALNSFDEYRSLKRILEKEIKDRVEIEESLIKFDLPSFMIDGFCAVCGEKSLFNTSFMYSYQVTEDGDPIPNWREHLDCVKCGMTNRIRAAMHIFYGWIKPSRDASIYITENTTPLYRWLKGRHAALVGSEYYGSVVPFGSEKNGFRNEDLTSLTFSDDSFDYILSFDVMEHVSDDIAALREVFRCLKPGGTFLFSAPFSKELRTKLVRARVSSNGDIEHLLPPEYHGNPIDQENGALCFRYFAWDLLDDMKKVGFEMSRVLNYWSRDFAYLGEEQFMFVASKPR